MADKTFQIRFDRHGHIIVDDAELEARLKWLLGHNGKLVIKLGTKKGSAASEVLPRLLLCPQPLSRCPAPANLLCPNYMCPEGLLHIVQQDIFEEKFGDLGQPGPDHG